MQQVTPWFPANVHPVRTGWYDFTGWLFTDQRFYWNGAQWGYWINKDWVQVAEMITDQWRGLKGKP